MSDQITLKRRYFFSHGTRSSCGVMIGYLGNKKFLINRISKDNKKRILIIEADTETQAFILLNLYNSNRTTANT